MRWVSAVLLSLWYAASPVSGGIAPVGATAPAHSASPTIRVGAIYPLKTGGQPAREEYRGLLTALKLVNQRGGVHGRRIRLDLRDVPGGDQAPDAVAELRRDHMQAIIGSESSLVGIPASRAANADHIFYLESGAVATMLTARGFPYVFRTVTTGQTLGRSAAHFAATVIARRLGLPKRRIRVVVLYIRDVYGTSVARAQIAETHAMGMRLVRVISYQYPRVNFTRVAAEVKRARPNVVLVAAYKPDAVAFRKATIRDRLRVGAMIGTSSSFCMLTFADALQNGALGLFAADKPDVTVNARALLPAARKLRQTANDMYLRKYGASMSAPAVAGFVGGWIMFHEVMPRAHGLSSQALRRAALRLDLPRGSEINGAGIRFARPSAPDAGQNLRAVSVVWQWQHAHPMRAVIVSPHVMSTGHVRFVPLPTIH